MFDLLYHCTAPLLTAHAALSIAILLSCRYCSYRRLLMWLPHGTAPGVTTDTLKKQMYLCKYRDPYNWETLCDQVQFELERVNKGQLLLTVPTLAVRQHYQFKVSGNPSIKDAYGLPLEDSYAWFFTTEPAADLSYPELASGAPVSAGLLLVSVLCCTLSVDRTAAAAAP